ncbi:serine/threonine-protein kinase bud32 [Glutinoglossum americanum]|uniref:EKC/KEOPS complex subunit BUD32 n=1 Tax=Glutinoglossum americanum TaxID=1670608 RepID=A0A9P8HUB2_9PEZI|nr:serine/threonine-protein kinase bud32 [Glutinoglossum americanum]
MSLQPQQNLPSLLLQENSQSQSSSTPHPALPTLPPTFTTQNPPTLLTQGAEALIYKTTYLTPHLPAALKHRPPKPYRHPTLDARLTRHRILSEARILTKCRREGVRVPAVYFVDWEQGWMLMEWIGGGSVRDALAAFLTKREVGEESVRGLMGRVGRAVGRLHVAGVVHGDLTTSNLMLQPTTASSPLDGQVVLIDFGLGAVSVQDEDKAVDLYVLERAFISTHPKAEGLFQEVLRSYEESYKGAKVVLRRLEDVRMRGRKRSMVG